MQHFLMHDEAGKKRRGEPRCGDLTNETGRHVAGRFLSWLQEGSPGYTNNSRRGRKALQTLVRSACMQPVTLSFSHAACPRSSPCHACRYASHACCHACSLLLSPHPVMHANMPVTHAAMHAASSVLTLPCCINVSHVLHAASSVLTQ